MKIFSSKPGESSVANRAAAVMDFVKFDAKISDKDLLKLCKRYGANALLWRRRFAGLLPEVEKRQLYEKKNFSSIFVFAAKLAGMRKEHVRRVLNVAKKFEAMPILKAMLENGEVSVNKLARIASIATPENQEFWAAQAQNLSQSALETLVRDEKYLREKSAHELEMDGESHTLVQGLGSGGRQISENALGILQDCDAVADFELQKIEPKPNSGSSDFQNQNGLFEPKSEPKSVRAHTFISSGVGKGRMCFMRHPLELASSFALDTSVSCRLQRRPAPCARNNEELNLSPAVKEKLLNLQRKGIDVNELLTEFLEKRDEEIAEEKEKLAAEIKPTNSRHVAAEIDKLIAKEFGTKCSIDWCMREAQEIHHLQRFSLSRKHDPRYLAPFCEEHHAIAHSIDLKLQEKRSSANR